MYFLCMYQTCPFYQKKSHGYVKKKHKIFGHSHDEIQFIFLHLNLLKCIYLRHKSYIILFHSSVTDSVTIKQF